MLEKLGTESIATISAGNVTGTLVKLDPKDSEDINCGIKESGDMNVCRLLSYDIRMAYTRD